MIDDTQTDHEPKDGYEEGQCTESVQLYLWIDQQDVNSGLG